MRAVAINAAGDLLLARPTLVLYGAASDTSRCSRADFRWVMSPAAIALGNFWPAVKFCKASAFLEKSLSELGDASLEMDYPVACGSVCARREGSR